MWNEAGPRIVHRAVEMAGIRAAVVDSAAAGEVLISKTDRSMVMMVIVLGVR